MTNTILTSDGNDFAIDNIALVDVTPRLSKGFVSTIAAAGGVTQAIFTVTNTTDNLAKPGWSFTDALSPGLTLANTTIGGTCRNDTNTAGSTATLSSGSVGSTSFSIIGGLPAQASCTVIVNLRVASTVNTTPLQNCASNITSTNYVLPPASSPDCANLSIGRNVTLTKQWVNAGSGNAVNLAVQDASSTAVATGASTAPASGATGNGVLLIGSTATLTETFTAGSPASYAKTIVCRKTTDNSVVATAPVNTSGNVVSTTMLVPSDSDVACTFTNTGTGGLRLVKSVPNGQGGTAFDFSQTGIPAAATGAPNAASVSAFALTPSTVSGASQIATQTYTNVPAGVPVTLNELASAAAASFSLTNMICTDGSGAPAGSTFTYSAINNGATNGSAKGAATVNLVAGADVTCSFTNVSTLAALQIVKTGAPATVPAGGLVNYTLTVTNSGTIPVTGAQVRDSPAAGLNCTQSGLAAPTCSACTGAITAAALLAAPGVTLATLAPAATATITLQCRVTATGQ